MKKAVIMLAVSFFIMLYTCREVGIKNKHLQSDIPVNFITDSVIEEDLANIFDSLTVKYSSQLLVFPSIKDKTLLQNIYDKKNITDFTKEGLAKYLEAQKRELYSKLKKTTKLTHLKHLQKWEKTSQMNIKFNENQYLHIQYYESMFIGGVYNYYNYTERVFDLNGNKELKLQDITSMSKDRLSEILNKNIDKTTMMQQMKKYDVLEYNTLLTKKVPMTTNFYFDENNLYFHYNTDEIAEGYSIGDIIIPISWNELGSTLNLKFKKRMKIK
ncbi:RsiV family protein [Chryseobacterium polytrichastri]|nr:RsiV family protein [Chryseobacterium polytrichastri]